MAVFRYVPCREFFYCIFTLLSDAPIGINIKVNLLRLKVWWVLKYVIYPRIPLKAEYYSAVIMWGY